MIQAEAQNVPTRRLTFQEGRNAYQSIIFAYVSRRIRPVEEAEDIVAHVFMDAFLQWGRHRGEPRLWLLGIARRKVCDALRSQRRSWTLKEEDGHRDGMQGFVEADEIQRALAVVMALPEDQRDALLMQVVEGMSIVEIALVMGRSVAAANSLLQRARAHIQKTVKSQSWEGEIK